MEHHDRAEGLPVYGAPVPEAPFRFQAGDGFWSDAVDAAASTRLVDHLDAAMSGASSPRVWLIVHESGKPELSCVAALAFARELAGRDQAALVLDCDEQGMALTIWSEREETEGWIDLARYGTSVLTAGVPMPFEGRRGYLLGVGSFAPTDVTPAEIEGLLSRLRRQADDVILVAPAAEDTLAWAAHADIRLLCWDRSVCSEKDLAALIGPFRARDVPLTGLVAFGEVPVVLAADAATTVVKSTADDEPVAPPLPDETAVPPAADAGTERMYRTDLDNPPGLDDSGIPAADDEPAGEIDTDTADRGRDSRPETDTAAEADGEDDSWADGEVGWRPPDSFGDGPARKGTSGIFWFLAAASTFIIAIFVVYYLKYDRVPREGHFGPVATTPLEAPSESGPERDLETTGPEAVQSDPRAMDGGDGTLAAVGGAEPVGEQPGDDDDAAEVRSPFSTPTETPTETPIGAGLSADDPADAEMTVADQTADVVTTDDPAAAGPLPLDMTSYTDPVGTAGWAVWVYSFPDSSLAHRQMVELRRRGFTSAERIVEIKDKGRWWRVYLGSFASRRAAQAAIPSLCEALKEDWAAPEQFNE